jgi:hypothetical protein
MKPEDVIRRPDLSRPRSLSINAQGQPMLHLAMNMDIQFGELLLQISDDELRLLQRVIEKEFTRRELKL